jgi:hypothetical protein
MSALDMKDLQALFVLLALIFLLDSVGGHFLIVGVVIFAIMIALVFYSKQIDAMKLDRLDDNTIAWIVRIGILGTLLGVLLQSFVIIAFAFLFAELLLFLPIEGLDLDLWSAGASAIGAKSTTTKGKGK